MYKTRAAIHRNIKLRFVRHNLIYGPVHKIKVVKHNRVLQGIRIPTVI